MIVSFYFDARHQVKSQNFQREIVGTMAHVPQVMSNIKALRTLRAQSIGVADSGSDAQLASASLAQDSKAALEAWRQRTV